MPPRRDARPLEPHRFFQVIRIPGGDLKLKMRIGPGDKLESLLAAGDVISDAEIVGLLADLNWTPDAAELKDLGRFLNVMRVTKPQKEVEAVSNPPELARFGVKVKKEHCLAVYQVLKMSLYST